MNSFDFIKTKEKEITSFLQELVRAPSQNGIDPERNIAALIYKRLKRFGLKPSLLVGEKNRPTILCYCNKSKGRNLWLDAPLDTVAIGDKNKWKYPPFSGKIVGGKLYGRGSADCKAAIAIFTYIAAAISQSQERLKGQLLLSFDSDEQSGNFTGIKNLLRKGVRADACIIGYPGTEEIIIGARGFLRLNITTFGKTAHTGSREHKGLNAISKMVKVIQSLEKFKMKYKKSDLFKFGPNLTVSQIEGGRAINIVPDECNIKVDIRLAPSQTKDTVMKEINDLLKKLKKNDPELRVKIEPYLYEAPFQTSKNSRIIKILKKNAEKILGKRIKIAAAGGSGIGNETGNKGIPTITGFGVDFNNIHSENEYILVNSILPVTKIYLKTVLDFLIF